jgi:hypothetical protein
MSHPSDTEPAIKRRPSPSLPPIPKPHPPPKRLKLNPKKKLQVYCRFRPISPKDTHSDIYSIQDSLSTLTLNAPDNVIRQNGRIDKYTFTKIFDQNSPQNSVFKAVMYPLITDILVHSKNGVVFTYGVTNSGKTHTIIGRDMYSEDMKGIIPRTAEIFLLMKSKIDLGGFGGVICEGDGGDLGGFGDFDWGKGLGRGEGEGGVGERR